MVGAVERGDQVHVLSNKRTNCQEVEDVKIPALCTCSQPW